MNDRRNQIFRRNWAFWALLLMLRGQAVYAFDARGESARADVSGVWDLTVESQDGTAHPVITVKQDGQRLTGSYEGKIGVRSLTGTLKDNEITFVVKLKFRDVDYDVTYTGTVDNDSMKGLIRSGDAGSGSWTAKRRKNDS
jgi:hypothetical protein